MSFNAFDPYDTVHNLHVDVEADHYKIVREIGAQGAVLLKNTRGALPLQAPRSVLVVGSDAGSNPMGANGCTDPNSGHVSGIMLLVELSFMVQLPRGIIACTSPRSFDWR